MDRAIAVTVCMLIHLSSCQFDKNTMGPFRAVVDRVDHCEDSGLNLFYFQSTRISKVGRDLYVYSTNFTALEELSDNISIYSDIAVWGNGGWRPHFFQFDFPNGCENVKYYFPTICYKTGLDKCPLPPGVYETNILTQEISKIKNLPIFQYGKYRADCYFMRNDTVLGCSRWYYEIAPRRIIKKKPTKNL